ncbi:hypothetical protein HK102_006518, partial [Quaeritorhiza haematococci]
MSNSMVPTVYQWIIQDVVEKMTRQFADMGVDESVMQELQQTWEAKLVATRVAPFPKPANSSTAEGAGTGVPVAGPAAAGSAYNGFNGASNGGEAAPHPYPPSAAANLAALAAVSTMSSAPQHLGGYRIQQTDGANDDDDLRSLPSSSTASMSTPEIDQFIERRWAEQRRTRPGKQRKSSQKKEDEIVAPSTSSLSAQAGSSISQDGSSATSSRKGKERMMVVSMGQVDGADDDDDDDDDPDDDNDGIGSDLDDDDSEEEEHDAEHMILCQYEKVTRIKNKWKCVLKDGIVNVNGKDYLFNK